MTKQNHITTSTSTSTTPYLRSHPRKLQSDDNESITSSGIDGMTIIYIAAGAAVGVIMIILTIYCYRRRLTSKPSRTSSSDARRLVHKKQKNSSSPSSRSRGENGKHSSAWSNRATKTSSNSTRSRSMRNTGNGQHGNVAPVRGNSNSNASRRGSGPVDVDMIHIDVDLVKSPSTVSALTMNEAITSPYNNSSALNHRNVDGGQRSRGTLVDLDNFASDTDDGNDELAFGRNRDAKQDKAQPRQHYLSEEDDDDDFFFNNKKGFAQSHGQSSSDRHVWPPPNAVVVQPSSSRNFPDPEDVYPITSFDSESDVGVGTMTFASSFPKQVNSSSYHSQSSQQPPRPPPSSTPPFKGSPRSSPTQGNVKLTKRRSSPSLMDSDDEEEQVDMDDMQAAMNAAVLAAAASGNAGAMKAAKEIEKQNQKSKSAARASPTMNSISSGQGSRKSLRSNNNRKSDVRSPFEDSDDSDIEENSPTAEPNPWLFEAVKDTMGPRIASADMESLGGRSRGSRGSRPSTPVIGASAASVGNRSVKSNRPRRKSRTTSNRSVTSKKSSSSVGSGGSRRSYRSHKSHKSTLSQMSNASRSIAADLMRLETQLAMVGDNNGSNIENVISADNNSISKRSLMSGISSRGSNASSFVPSSHSRRIKTTKRDKMNVVVPPGKLGVILSNKADNRGTIVSDVRTTSVLYGKIFPGDRIVAIDNEDVSAMTVAEITALMARKAAYDRVLTIITSVKLNNQR